MSVNHNSSLLQKKSEKKNATRMGEKKRQGGGNERECIMLYLLRRLNGWMKRLYNVPIKSVPGQTQKSQTSEWTNVGLLKY